MSKQLSKLSSQVEKLKMTQTCAAKPNLNDEGAAVSGFPVNFRCERKASGKPVDIHRIRSASGTIRGEFSIHVQPSLLVNR